MFYKYVYFATFLFCLLISPVVSAQDTTQEPSSQPRTIEYTVIADTANLRSEAKTTAKVVGKVSKGESLLIYDEKSESGWLKVYRTGAQDAYIADFLVERAPLRFYPVDQKPILEIEGKGKKVSEVFDIPKGAYRIDAIVSDRSFILSVKVVNGQCEDETLFNELNFDANRLTLSGLFISQGCSVIFQTENVTGIWSLAVRDLVVSIDFIAKNTLKIEKGTSISGVGRALTMSTFLPQGMWTISAKVNDNSYILHPRVLSGDCDTSSAFNEFDTNTKKLELSTAYRSPKDGCIIFWETSNVDGSWEISFMKIS